MNLGILRAGLGASSPATGSATQLFPEHSDPILSLSPRLLHPWGSPLRHLCYPFASNIFLLWFVFLSSPVAILPQSFALSVPCLPPLLPTFFNFKLPVSVQLHLIPSETLSPLFCLPLLFLTLLSHVHSVSFCPCVPCHYLPLRLSLSLSLFLTHSLSVSVLLSLHLCLGSVVLFSPTG